MIVLCPCCGSEDEWEPPAAQPYCVECQQPMCDPDSPIKIALDLARLSQRGAARTLGINERTMRRYVSGETPTPKIVLLALEALARRR